MYLPNFNEQEQALLLGLARRSVLHGIQTHLPYQPTLNDFNDNLVAVLASFVTLKMNGALRGCIGSLQACQPLVIDVAQNAFSSAFADPRFSPLCEHELNSIRIQISVLSSPEAIEFVDEQNLLEQLNPGLDGLILQDGRYRSTFLPIVWETLPAPALFLAHLKQKAGLSQDYWSPTIQFFRYATVCFSEESIKHHGS